MHTCRNTPSALGTAGRRLRITLAALAATFCAIIVVTVPGAATASAAGPDTLAPGESVIYPTWFWGATEFCATNNSGDSGMVRVRAVVNIDDQTEDIFVPAFETRCIRRWWWANPIEVTNTSDSELGTSADLTTSAE